MLAYSAIQWPKLQGATKILYDGLTRNYIPQKKSPEFKLNNNSRQKKVNWMDNIS